MIDNIVLSEIVSKVPHKLRKEWYQDRIDKLKGMNVSDKNLKVSKLIDSLNSSICSIELIEDEFVDNFSNMIQLSFDFG